MTIEILKKADLKLYKELIDGCFGSSNELSHYEKSYTENNNYIIYVAKKDDKIVASITLYKIDLFTFSFQPALEIFNVAVLEEYRGQKIAKLLFNEVLKYAKNNKYQSIYLTCLDNAFDAHHLYESLGFTETSSLKYNLKINYD